MKVKEVILYAAALLGDKAEVENFFKGTSTNAKEQVDMLLSCFNMVENELALDYVPLMTEEKFSLTSGKLPYSLLKQDVVRIVHVKGADGEYIPFRIFAQYLEVGEGAKQVTVQYAYTPKAKTIEQDSDFRAGVSARLMAYGVAAEYCVAMGMCSEAAVWDKKYKECIASARSVGRKDSMPSRRWV